MGAVVVIWSAATLGLAAATFPASAVEFVEAFTIVLAMGLSRSWRAALTGTAAAVLALQPALWPSWGGLAPGCSVPTELTVPSSRSSSC